MLNNHVKQANRAALLKNLLSGGAAAATRAVSRPAAVPLSRMSDLAKGMADRSGVSQFARQEVVRPFKLAPNQAAAGERYLQGLGAAPSVPQQAAARLLNLTDRTARLGGDAAATAGNLLSKSLPTVNQGVGQFVKTLPNLLSNPLNRLPVFNQITAAMQGLKGYLPKALRLAVPGTATGAMSAGVLGHSLANTGKQVGEIYNDSVRPTLDKVNALTAAPDVSDKMQNAYNATGAATKAITSAMTSPVVTNLITALGNTPAVAAARDKAQIAASNAGTNAIRGLASDLSYNVGTGMFRNTPIKLMANASPAMAAAHAAFNAYNPGLPRLSTEELKKRIAQRSLSSIQDEFTGMLPWSRK